MNINIEFLKDHVNETAWQIIYNLKQSYSLFNVYCFLIKSIKDKDSDALDNNTDAKGDAMYVAAGLAGDKFWSVFEDQIKQCVRIDAEEGDLSPVDSRLLLKMLS